MSERNLASKSGPDQMGPKLTITFPGVLAAHLQDSRFSGFSVGGNNNKCLNGAQSSEYLVVSLKRTYQLGK